MIGNAILAFRNLPNLHREICIHTSTYTKTYTDLFTSNFHHDNLSFY